MDVFHHYLEAIEAASFGNLNLSAETLDQVLVDDSIGRGEKRQDVGNKVSLIIVDSVVPVVEILREIDLFRGPE